MKAEKQHSWKQSIFSPEQDGVEALFGDVLKRDRPEDLVPKNKKANFSEKIIIRATLIFENGEKEKLAQICMKELQLVLNTAKIDDSIIVERVMKFENSEHVDTRSLWDLELEVKSKRAKIFREIHSEDESWQEIVRQIKLMIPKISYYPTFLFDFPERIYLSYTPKNAEVNSYYVQIIKDVLDSLGENLDINTHILKRVEKTENPDSTWDYFLFLKSDEKEQIDHVMIKIANKITDVIFTRWNEIFNVSLKTKNIEMTWGVDKENDDGNKPVFLKFSIKDGQSKFDISERSLGFRWFFCFLLFTQFRSARDDSGAIFLFDEPASNLHSRAQEQLLKSFENIAIDNNMIIYSTHSHYMINTSWLENLFIITNDAIDYNEGLEDGEIARVKDTYIEAIRYRTFVGTNPDKMTYFQPILDKLDYAPSKLEFGGNSVLVEGKDDFYAFDYFSKIIFKEKHNVRFIPGSGANELGSLISIFLGWGLSFLILLDDDAAGRKARNRYRSEWLLDDDVCFTLAGVITSMKGKKLEHLISKDDKKMIAASIGKARPTKKDISRFFQEKFANAEAVKFDDETNQNFRQIITFVKDKLS